VNEGAEKALRGCLMFGGLVRKGAERELLQREWTRHSRQPHGLEGPDALQRCGKIRAGISRRRDADGSGEGTCRLIGGLLVQSGVERG
jgi:hypothetical protein